MTTDGYEKPDVIAIEYLPDTCAIECSICDREICDVPFFYKIDDATQICSNCKERERLRE
jgi:hypothetical protein